MTRISYSQEKTNGIIYIVPAVFVIASVIAIIVGFRECGFSLEFVIASLLPACGMILFVAWCFKMLLKQEKRKTDNFRQLKEQGQSYEGSILDIHTHEYQVHSGDSWDTKYSYTFKVQYYDPFTGENVVRESVKTYVHYDLNSSRCLLKVLNDQVLVEEADVTYHKDRWSALDIILVGGFLAVVIVIMAYTILPILKTL